jgi:hypothetical protein
VLHWEPHWTMAELEVFRARVEQAIAGERWVVDGNYSKVRDLVWGRADSVVWLDYPFALTFGRLVLRTIARIRSKQELWSGNRERFAGQFLARDRESPPWASGHPGRPDSGIGLRCGVRAPPLAVSLEDCTQV